ASRGEACLKCRTVPDHFGHVASFSCRDNETKRKTQVDRLGYIVDRFLKRGLLLAIHQFPAAPRQAVERRGGSVAVESISEKSFPIIPGNGAEWRNYTVKPVSKQLRAPVPPSRKSTRAIIP